MYLVVCAVDGVGRIVAARREATEDDAAAAVQRVQGEHPGAFYVAFPGGNEADFVADLSTQSITENPPAKSAAQIAGERRRALMALVSDLAILQVRLIQRLLANGTLTAQDLSAVTPTARQAYQDAAALADLLDP